MSTHTVRAQSWPSTWTWIDNDANEDGPGDDYRDTRAAFFNFDSQDLYLRMQLYAAPSFPDGCRYKWLLDVGVSPNMYQSGNIIRGSEYILFVEDGNPDDEVGEVYLLPANGDDTYAVYEPDYYKTNPGPITDNATAGYRFVTSGGNYYVDMYVSLSALGVSDAYGVSLWWATDQENPNLEQGPSTDGADAADAPFEIAAYTIVKSVTDVGGDGPSGQVDAAGDVISYRVVVGNTGFENLTGIALTDTLVVSVGSPTESMTSDGILEVGETWTWVYQYTATQAEINNNGGGDGDIDNMATVDCDQLAARSDSAAVLIWRPAGVRQAPSFPSIYVGIAAALGAGVLACFVRRRLTPST